MHIIWSASLLNFFGIILNEALSTKHQNHVVLLIIQYANIVQVHQNSDYSQVLVQLVSLENQQGSLHSPLLRTTTNRKIHYWPGIQNVKTANMYIPSTALPPLPPPKRPNPIIIIIQQQSKHCYTCTLYVILSSM